jgi:hypothetical protein
MIELMSLYKVYGAKPIVDSTARCALEGEDESKYITCCLIAGAGTFKEAEELVANATTKAAFAEYNTFVIYKADAVLVRDTPPVRTVNFK